MKLSNGQASASISSDVPMSNPNVSLIVSGKLEKEPAAGYFLVAFAEVGYNGCKSNRTFDSYKNAI